MRPCLKNVVKGKSDIVSHVFSPSTEETEVDGSLGVQGHLVLHSELQGSQDYIERLCLQQNKIKISKKRNRAIAWW